MMKRFFIAFCLFGGSWMGYAQPNLQKLEEKDVKSEWFTNPPATLLNYEIKGGSTRRNQYGQIVSTNEYGTLIKQPCYIVTDKYSTFAQRLGPQTYMIVGTFLYSFKGNRVNPNCVKKMGSDPMPEDISPVFNNYYTCKTPMDYYRRNSKGEKVLKKEKFPEAIRVLFEQYPEFYEKYSPYCKEMNYDDPVYVSLLIEALLRCDKADNGRWDFPWSKVVFSVNGFKAKSGKSSFRSLTANAVVATIMSPLEPVVPAGTESDSMLYYEQDECGYSQNYLEQVEKTKRIPKDYSGVAFKGEPCLLTDLYGFPAVYDDENMYYLQK